MFKKKTSNEIKMATSGSQLKELSTSLSKFALDLYQKMSEEKSTDNMFFSPYSIAVALSMTLAGAKGNTSKQMLDVMGIGSTIASNLHQTHEEYISLLEKVQEGYQLSTANRLYVNQNAQILPDFLQLVSKMYHSVSKNVDFGNSAKVTKEINDWVSEATNGKIKDLIPDDVLSSLTALVLVNAIYFKGKWDQAFRSQNTRTEDFFKTADEKVPVDMMFMEKKFLMKDDDSLGAKILELPYLGKDLSMYVILPHKIDGLKNVQTKVDAKFLDSCLCNDGFRMLNVELSLPKFKVNSSFDLGELLSTLGMSDLFDPKKSDLSGIGKGQLYVDKVLHKAFVEINEEGTEAAASTAVAVNCFRMTITYPFKANYPFMFFIADKRSRMVLFMGKLIAPESK